MRKIRGLPQLPQLPQLPPSRDCGARRARVRVARRCGDIRAMSLFSNFSWGSWGSWGNRNKNKWLGAPPPLNRKPAKSGQLGRAAETPNKPREADPIGAFVETLLKRETNGADFIRAILPGELLISQRVSVARALKPHIQKAARRRQGSTGTAPGRKARQRPPALHVEPFLARCVGLARKTLRMAIYVAEFVDQNPEHSHRIYQMDDRSSGGVARIFLLVTEGAKNHPSAWSEHRVNAFSPFGIEYGPELLRAEAARFLCAR